MATSGRFTSDAVAWAEQHNNEGNNVLIELWPEYYIGRTDPGLANTALTLLRGLRHHALVVEVGLEDGIGDQYTITGNGRLFLERLAGPEDRLVGGAT